jgi:isopentenyl-diphosphate delta-isomerase
MPKKKKKDKKEETTSRKGEHVSIVTTENVSYRTVLSGFDALRFEHNALPELSFDEIDTTTQFLGKHLDAPLLISSMTGGYEGAEVVNRAFAKAAKQFGLAIGIGSARQALENKKYHKTFSVVRKEYPDGLVFTNIGGAEVAALHSKNKLDDILRIVDLVEADAIIVHLNPLQEMMQPEGSRDFRGILSGIEALCKQFTIPVIVKEVGAGISKSTARTLVTHGVLAIDIAGAGGTSWAGVELLRQNEAARTDLDIFWDWGIPTVEALQAVRELKQSMTFGLIASGGIRTGLDVAKSIALGADLVGLAQPVIKAFVDGAEEGLFALMQTVIKQLRIAMLLSGSKTIPQLGDQILFPIK